MRIRCRQVLRRIKATVFVVLFCLGGASLAQHPTKHIVFLAGTKSHGPGDHEYEKSCRLLARTIRGVSKDFKTTVIPYGWPLDPNVLNTADTIVVFSDGSDHNRSDHPLLLPGRMDIIDKQMRRGCGFVTLHYATFAPLGTDGDRYVEWVGGHFDYESGASANHWASAIDNWNAEVHVERPDHPILRGVKPFSVQEEYYTQIRFRKGDRRRTDLLTTIRPSGGAPQSVGWAVERKDGGRGFGYTGGHPFANYVNLNIRKILCNAILWTAKVDVPIRGVDGSRIAIDDPIRVTILTGNHHPAHDWRGTTDALKQVVQKDTRIQVRTEVNPESLRGDVLDQTDVLLINYCNWETATLSDVSKRKLMSYVRSGGGVVLLHFANGAWRDWQDYHGGLSRRVWVDGKANHDTYGTFRVRVKPTFSRLTAGLRDFDTVDELYCSQVGSDTVEPLLTAVSKVTGKEEPLAYTYLQGNGRVVQTLLGHDADAVLTAEHAEFIRRSIAYVGGREILSFPLGETRVMPTLDVTARGTALDVSKGIVRLEGDLLPMNGPISGSFSVKLTQSTAYNVILASEVKSNPLHWELFTESGSGRLSVFTPGVTPAHYVSMTNICDGIWHDIGFTLGLDAVRLTVDGKEVLSVPCTQGRNRLGLGNFWVGGYPPDGLKCFGTIDNLVFHGKGQGVLDVSKPAEEPLLAFDFDVLLPSGFSSKGLIKASLVPITKLTQRSAVIQKTPIGASWPQINPRTSADWRVVGNDSGGMRYSHLTQVNKANVAKLRRAWEYVVDDATTNTTLECTPIIIAGVMYLTTASQKVIALQAATGKAIWEFDGRASGVNRGVAYWSDGKLNGATRILFGSTNGRVWSLNARTGKPDEKFGDRGSIGLRDGFERNLENVNLGVTSAPAVYQDLVIIPVVNTEGQPGAPGDVRAFNVRTGKEVWRFHTIPQPYEAGSETWLSDGWKNRSGANAWSGYTVDTARGIVFFGLGSAASDFYGGDRPGNNLFANCTVALDARTGQRLWHFQAVHHDLWDHDNPCPPLNVTVRHKGKLVDAVAQPTKTGYIFVFDRVTGKSLFPIVETAAPKSTVSGEWSAPTQPKALVPPPLGRTSFTDADITNRTPEATRYIREQLKALLYGKSLLPPSVQGTVTLPGFHGGATWSGASYDPDSNYLFINTNELPSVIKLNPNGSGGYDFNGYTWFYDQEGYPANKPPWGWLTAVDLSTGKFAWRHVFGSFPELEAKGQKGLGSQTFGGTIVTKGGLVFIAGSPDEKLHAFDKATGKELWSADIDAGGYATPATYMVNGKQFIVIAAGGGGKIGTRSGKKYIAFALD